MTREEKHPRSSNTHKNAKKWRDAIVDAAWEEKNRKEREFEQRRGTANNEGFIKPRIERNNAKSQFKRTAARITRAQWDRLYGIKANLNTMEF